MAGGRAGRIHARRGGAITALLALALLASPVRAQEWTYTARAGDNLWVLAQEYLVSMRHWAAFRALNPVPDPRRMRPGTRIRFPVRWLRVQPAPAVVVAASGDSRVATAGGAEAAVAVGAAIPPGARLITGEGSSVVLRFADGSTMLIRPDTEVRMDDLGLYGRAAMVDTRARVQRGRVELDVPPEPRNRLEITTPSASALVRGTRFRVSGEADVARAEVLAGGVRVASSVASVDLPAGTGTRVRAGQPPEPPRALLPAPDLGGVPERVERRERRLRWAVQPGASGYRVQIATTEAVPTLLLDVPSQVPAVQLPDLPDGRYELRVRALDDLGLEGLDARRTFTLDARPEPPATLEPRPDQIVRVTRPVLRWTEPADAVAYHVQLASDAAFTLLRLDRTGVEGTRLELDEDLAPGVWHWRVASVDAAGEQGPYGDVVQFTVRPSPPAPGGADPRVGENDVLLRWLPGESGQTYEVELASTEDFGGDVRTERVSEPQLVIPTPENDVWFRVRIVDTDGYRGPFGTPQRIEAPREDPWWLLVVPLLILLL